MFSLNNATNPNNTVWMALVCLICPGPLGAISGFLLATAIHKHWIKIKVDTTNLPKLRHHRND